MESCRKMTEIYYEPLKKSHLEGIINIEQACFVVPWSKEAFLQELKNDIAVYIVAMQDDEVIGYGGMWIILDESHITNVAVAKSYQRQGIAKKIVEQLIERSEQEKAFSMTLEVRKSNNSAISLYKKFSFKEVGIRKGYYENNNEDALIMWRKSSKE